MVVSRVLFGLIAIVGSLVAGSMAMRRGGVDPSHGGAPMPVPPGLVVADGESGPANVPVEAIQLMEQGRPWRAARFMAGFLGGTAVPTPEAILFAARAEAAWGGWRAARQYLEGKPWLDGLAGGEGWCVLGRAREESGDVTDAAEAYRNCLAPRDDPPPADVLEIAELRAALLRLRLAGAADGDPLAPVRRRSPEIEDWLNVLSTESLAETGDTTGVRLLTLRLPQEAGMRHRGRVALLRAYGAAGDNAGLVRTAGTLKGLGGTATQRAELSLMAGRAAIASGDAGAARRELREAIDLAPGSTWARESATLLLDVRGITNADRLAIADVDERHGNNTRAAAGYRRWLEAGGGSAEQRRGVQLRLGRALFNAGEFTSSEATLRPLLGGPPAIAREAMMLTGRSEYRRGATEQAFTTFERLASSHPGSVEGSEALYLVADLRHDAGEIGAAGAIYRRVASGFPGTDRAGLSLMRLAGIHYLAGDYARAAAAWEEYRTSYPTGERWLQATYWAGRAYEEQGNPDRAGPLYHAVRRRDALSYYAVLAAERLGTTFWPLPMSASPPEDPAARRRIEGWLAGVDLLRSAGLHSEAEAEVDRVVARAGSETPNLYALAEALNERGYAIRGIRIGQDLQRSGSNLRLLRILYPFPYREIVAAEAREKELDPFVVAALMRQESLFTARISSPVGARGLMQIMPQTGDALARGVGIDPWSADMLFQPEINIHLGTRYLAEQMDRYDASLPSVFSAYNAGPHRIDAWKELPEYGDEELFTERIPYRETRDYVKILTRNIELYRGLYGG